MRGNSIIGHFECYLIPPTKERKEMIITKATPVTTIDLWFPRYYDKSRDNKEWVALPAVYRVEDASNVIRIVFSRAKHLKGYEGYMRRSDMMKYPIGSNGKLPCYVVPMDKLERNETPEILETIESLGW